MLRRRMLMNQARLPSEYQEVEWIGADGTQWIDTGIVFANPLDFIVENKFMLYSGYTSDNCVMGGRTSSSRTAGFKFPNCYNGNYETQGYFGTTLAGVGYDTPVIYKATNADDICTVEINGTTYTGTYNADTTYNGIIALFGMYRNDGIAWLYHGRGYYSKVTQNDVLYRDYVPCYRKSDGVIGMYDLCESICSLTNSPFYINSGTGTFMKGADVN